MKRTLFILMIILFSNLVEAQESDYKNLWSKVEALEAKGLPKSALKVVESINKQAKKDKNHPQFIKTMLVKSKFALVLEEDAQLKIINDFKNEIKLSEFPTKNILENILANLYWQYFNQHRWQFYNRTKTDVKVDVVDFRIWDLQTLFNEIHFYYQKSLERPKQLQLEPLSTYNALLNKQKGSKLYRPTLFDFLSHNALQFYKTNETHITKPAYKFEIDNKDFLADAVAFSKLKIASKDSSSLQLNALKIYQKLIQFHLEEKSVQALASVNIERLKFINQHATFSNKQTILLDALKTESETLKTHEVSGLYDFEIAYIFHQQSTTYVPKTKEEHRWKTKDAISICNRVIAKFPKSKGAENCLFLKQQIEQKTLQITAESFLPILKNSRLLIRYKNLNQLEFKIFKISRNQLETFNKTYKKEAQLAFINKLNPITKWNSILRDENDFQTHTTEILIPKLNNGRYLIYASPKNNENLFAFSTIQVSDLALVETEKNDCKIFQIINRNNGKPISNAKVELNFNENNNGSKITENYTTDLLGRIEIEKNKERYRNANIKVEYDNDIAYFGNFYINQSYEKQKINLIYKTFLFTDRSIYRPGQIVYFKAIAMKTEDKKSEVLENEKTKATLYNTNGEKLKELELKTNEFGSVSGTFILPNTGLNGQYHIKFETESGYYNKSHSYFSVEEYKRPKFETKFNPIAETYKINDSITVKGHALAYAGSPITNAKVVYRVHRKVEYPHWYFWHRPWFNSEPQEITFGEGITNDKGEFEITFKAQPDQSIDKSNLPIFNYEVTTHVTDLNGETRSATTVVKVGYHALIANMSLSKILDKTKKTYAISIDTKNLNGEFVPAKGTIKIFKLQAPSSVLRPRPWAAPDYQDFTEEEFRKIFPNESYNNEQNPNNWEKGELVLNTPFNTKNSTKLNLGNIKKWESGAYLITLESKDKFGQTVKDEIKTTLFSLNDKKVADHQLFSITSNKSSYAVGDTAIITLGSAAHQLNVTISIEQQNKLKKTKIIQLNDNKKTIKIPITKEDIGGFSVAYTFAAFNSFKSGILNITVPYPKTDLQIETITFRDKLQPGTDETWSFKIKGPKGDKASAELLASMYDASLDQFKPHNWGFNPINNPTYYSYNNSNARQSFGKQDFRVYNDVFRGYYQHQNYDQLNWFGLYFGNNHNLTIRGASRLSKRHSVAPSTPEIVEVADEAFSEFEDDVMVDNGELSNTEDPSNKNALEKLESDFSSIKIRKNLQETAFFFPQLKTDETGAVSFSFTTPEALTQWKLQLLAHSKTLESATKSLTTITQKELMVIPNAPRFLRQGDTINISTKIANLTDKTLSGQAVLILTDAISGEDITAKLLTKQTNNLASLELERAFNVYASGNTQVSWQLSIPDNLQAVQYKIIAKAGDFSDGEQNALPVLSNRMLVTETLSMWVKSNETKTFTLDKLKNNSSSTLKNHKLTLEITSNPAWYAVQALPYLMEYPYDCSEQIFSRYYANALASFIANSNSRIQEVFNQWRTSDALLSNLEKNAELKSILIQETPWLRDAQSETEQKKRIALLFDLNKMTNELETAKRQMEQNQMPSGAWAWFKDGPENRYITQHIIAGFGHLNKLTNTPKTQEISTEKGYNQMILKAIEYLDEAFVKEYEDIRKYDSKIDLNKDHLSHTQLHYLYMRSFYPDVKKSDKVEDITAYYKTQIQKYWLKRSLYAKGLMVLIVDRMEDKTTSAKILKALKENSITSEELGMYWKANTNSWHWYQAPIETQALLIEAFSEVGTAIQSEAQNLETIDNLKIWLLKNKQTNRWKTTKATTQAVYALLLQGSDWLSVTDTVDVIVGGEPIAPLKLEDVNVEAGTGYFKTSWHTTEIKPEMANVQLSKKGDGVAWGALYWQYFEDLDHITSAETPLKLNKNLFLKTNTATGEQISEITANTKVKLGDLVRVRIELRSDRAMEFLHLKDLRAAGLEPINVISTYKWQDGLGYYESTKDASTNFFFDYLPKGVYVFEYDLRVNNAGNMSNGITTIQSMYAPEFSSHSEGVRLTVD